MKSKNRVMLSALPAIGVAILLATPSVSSAQVACLSADSDSDGDGWGWENNASCVVTSVTGSVTGHPECSTSDSDPDGDGWGWENSQTCQVIDTPSVDTPSSVADCLLQDSDPDGDGWGWENSQSCRAVTDNTSSNTSSAAECTGTDSDPDGDGWGWENNTTCRVSEVATETTPETEPEADVIDIYDAIFTERSADCADYVNTLDATVVDIQNSISFNSDVVITATDTECTFTSNSVPNHDFNDDTAAFAGGTDGATITAIDAVLTVTRNPQFADSPTFITQELKNAIFINGVKLDIISAGCYNPTSADANEFGEVGIGCQSDAAWLLDPLSIESKFGADLHNGHTQPEGLYHYHGGPNAMFDDNPGSDGSPVIGFAADGFPVYGSYFYDTDTGQVRKALSGYSIRTGSRGETSDTNPGGDYTGRYNDDWEFTDAGDLDQCNGMTVDGQYGYYVTDSYPWVIKCLQGTPNDTFGGGTTTQTGPGGPPQGGQPQ